MKKVLLILSVLFVALALNAQVMYPFGGASVTAYDVADGNYDTTTVSPFNNLTVYNFTIDTSTAVLVDIDSDIRTGAELVINVYSDTTDASNETKTINLIGSDIYSTESDTIQQLKTYIYLYKYDGSKFFKVKEGQVD